MLPVSAQLMADDVIALFKMTVEGDRALVVEERHYRLVLSRRDRRQHETATRRTVLRALRENRMGF
jgi:hypothetical protein